MVRIYGLAAVVLMALCCASLMVGATPITAHTWQTGEAWTLIRDSRLPRNLAVLLAGASLAIAGQIMQLIARNRFVEPMTAGTGQSAVLGILLVTIGLPGAPLLVQMFLASLTALLGSLGFIALTQKLPVTQPLLVPLVGLVFGGIIGASAVYIAVQYDMLQYLEIWTSGEFSGIMRGRYELLWIAGISAALCYVVADQFSILGLGSEVSLNLGLNYKQVVLGGLAMISVVTGLTVVTIGMIPFVGLVVPNLVSYVTGDNLRRSLPVTAWAGATLVLAADLLARLVIHPFEIPVTTIIGIVGAGVFLWMLYGRRLHAA